MNDEEIRARKKELRAALRKRRAAIAPEDRACTDALITEGVAALDEFKRACMILTYVSIGSEVDTHLLIEHALAAGKTVAAPRVTGPHTMEWYCIDGLKNLEMSSFGVPEPPANARLAECAAGADGALALVPGFAFSPQGFRLGYGGGFYDAFLQAFSGVSVGLCRAAFLLDDIGPTEEHDRPVDIVVAEHRIVRPGRAS